MLNEVRKSDKSLIKMNDDNILVNNNEKEKHQTSIINRLLEKEKYKINGEITPNKFNSTISYSRAKYIKFFSLISKSVKKIKILSKPYIQKAKRYQNLSNKIIQTPLNFFDNNKSDLSKSFYCKKKKAKLCLYPNLSIKQLLKSRIFSMKKTTSFNQSKNYDNPLKFPNSRISRNKLLNPIPNHSQISKNKKLVNKMTNANIPLNIPEKTIHRNLVNIENVYKEGRQHYIKLIRVRKINSIVNSQNFDKNTISRKIAIKKIKYPSMNSDKLRKIKIINENNEHLLKQIYKNQTVSNFNNKYKLKYKTNDENKKENIKFLFSLLKKYKYSDKDKNYIFDIYNKMNQKSKYDIIY